MPEQTMPFPTLQRELVSGSNARRWCVAFSGGLDSCVLLHLLKTWCDTHPGAPELMAWHINHGMQAEAPAWEEHCAALCKSWGIPFRSQRVSVNENGSGAEAAAREARYALFEQDLQKGELLFMAHHLDDQVETFFLRLMRGSGLRGLSGIPAQRTLGQGRLVRPLLDVSREELSAYASAQALSHIVDGSNQDTSLDRNFLRHEILPQLEARWAGYRQTVQRASEHVGSALSTLEDNLPEPVTVYSTLGDIGLPLQVLTSGARDVAAIRLRAWLHKHGLAMPARTVVDEFLRQLNEAAEEAAPRMDCGSYVLQRYGDAVYLLPEELESTNGEGFELRVGESCNPAGLGGFSLVPASSEGLALAEGELLEIRCRTGGERCRPKGRAHSQTLKRLLQEKAVPPWWRNRIPIVLLDGEMLAVGDLWLCESSRLGRADQAADRLWQPRWHRNTFAPVD